MPNLGSQVLLLKGLLEHPLNGLSLRAALKRRGRNGPDMLTYVATKLLKSIKNYYDKKQLRTLKGIEQVKVMQQILTSVYK